MMQHFVVACKSFSAFVAEMKVLTVQGAPEDSKATDQQTLSLAVD